MKVFLETLFLQLLFTPYLYYRGAQALPKGFLRAAFRVLLVAQAVLALGGYALHTLLPKEWMSFFIKVTGTWALLCIYIVPLVLLVNLWRRLDKRSRGPVSRLAPRAYARVKLGLFMGIAATSALLLWDGYGRVYRPAVRYYAMTLPAAPDSLPQPRTRILFISDLHFSETIGPKHAAGWIELCREQNPDLILVGGDMFDYWSHFGYHSRVMELMRSLKAPLGTYYVMGNHEYRADTPVKEEWVPLVGGTLLKDTVLALPGGLELIARDDYSQKSRPELRTLVQRIPPQDKQRTRILLEHQPVQLDSLSPNGIFLALYGHTHNGQIVPFTQVVQLAWDNAYGYERKGSAHTLVSSGLGAAGPALRFFTRSEIVVIDLLPAH